MKGIASLSQTLIFIIPKPLKTQCRGPQILQTMNSLKSKSLWNIKGFNDQVAKLLDCTFWVCGKDSLI